MKVQEVFDTGEAAVTQDISLRPSLITGGVTVIEEREGKQIQILQTLMNFI